MNVKVKVFKMNKYARNSVSSAYAELLVAGARNG